jgi:hypothetical protein
MKQISPAEDDDDSVEKVYSGFAKTCNNHFKIYGYNFRDKYKK